MKKNKITKIIGLLGVGSLVSLSISSCTAIEQVVTQGSTRPNDAQPNENKQPTKPVENQQPSKSVENQQPSQPVDNSNNNSNNIENNNVSENNNRTTSNANTGNTGSLSLQSARAELNTLIDSQNDTLKAYDDYAKIKKDLENAYASASEVSNNGDASQEAVSNAVSALQTAINTANSTKDDFNRDNAELVTTFNSLKLLLDNKRTTLALFTNDNYATINNHLKSLYDNAQSVIDKSLSPLEGDKPSTETLKSLNDNLTTASSDETINTQKQKADELRSGFSKFTLNNENLAGVDEQHNNPQPWNYSFIGYSVDLGGTTGGAEARSATDINFSFGRRKLWSNATTVAPDSMEATDVSWIYGLFGPNAKYSLTFDYYGPTNAYLYFPYKLVKQADADKIALQYKLNDGQPTQVSFSSSDQSDNPQANPTPSVNKINVAKLALTGLANGSNKVEFSLPTEQDKVAPMIGNMYLTSNIENTDKVYNSIFGNEPTTDNPNEINVDLVKGYGLAADYSTYLAPYTTRSTNVSGSTAVRRFLLDYVGNTNTRNSGTSNGMSSITTPTNTNDNRTFIFYVNAPQAGDYSIKGTYYTAETRGLNFALDGSTEESKTLKINNLLSTPSWNSLSKKFDTNSDNQGSDDARQSRNTGLTFSRKTLHLDKGLNKIVITGNSTITNKNTPILGELIFTLIPPATTETTPADAPANAASTQPMQPVAESTS
ncbi:FIVAR domain-containing protein [Mycoplasma tullyi]|uniref:FIVAR domain-containing protein n=1 Tax=Mycoplasma tullyi TaxID=1612150 RepID=A0A7D7UGB9_9MOLU|nr:FIVAR domain-containing protein [Mycoplasma tullyi]QMT98806.1 FIVAR domain-containing protein [Mycoplasma tullyi]